MTNLLEVKEQGQMDKNTPMFEELNTKTVTLQGNVNNHGLVQNAVTWKKK